MAPNLRTLRSSSRTTSQNPSRPVTPQDATPAEGPSNTGTASAPPRKQRKTGRNARVAVDPAVEAGPSGEASGSGGDAKSKGLGQPNSGMKEPEWVEPELCEPRPSSKDHPKNPFDGTYITATMQPLGTMPPSRLRRAKVTPSRLAPRQDAKGKKRALDEGQQTNGNKRPRTASPFVEGPGQADAPREEGSAGPLRREERVTRSTRSKTGNDAPAGEAPATVNGHGPAVPPVPTSRSRDRISEIVEAAIQKAEGRNDLAVSRGLRRIWDASSTDPFLLTVLDAVLNHNADAHQRSVFQTVMRDASKSVQAGGQAGEPMARTQSGQSSSSLSTAKSLDPETFAPQIVSGPAQNEPAPKAKAAKAAKAKGKGKGRAGPSGKQPVAPPKGASLTKKRALEDDPDYSEDALAAKRRALGRSFEDVVAQESDVRPVVGPAPDADLPVPDPADVEMWELDREALGAGIDLGLDANSPNDGVPAAPAQMESATAAHSAEIDNNDFCRVCNGSGQLLCCDGCVDSFHFSCLDPPVNADSPPEGQWFCPSCKVRGPFGVLMAEMERTTQTLFALPASLRTHFEGVAEEDSGRYGEQFSLRPGQSRIGHPRREPQEELRDSQGRLIVCFRCRKASDFGRKPMYHCDYCPCSWHIDCLDLYPLTGGPPQNNGPGWDHTRSKKYWMCPNHIEHSLAPLPGYGGRVGRHRRARDPQTVDVDVPVKESEPERFLERDSHGTVYRVSEHGIMLNFIERVKRDRAAADKRAAEEAARIKSNTSRQNAEDMAVSESNQGTVGTPGPSTAGAAPVNAANAALSSHSGPDYEAAMNLVALSQSGRDSERAGVLIQQMTEVEQLRSLQEMIERRIEALSSGAVPSDN